MLVRKKHSTPLPKSTTPNRQKKSPGEPAQFIKGYSEEELYELWLRFKGNDDSLSLLADFMSSDKATAKAVLNKFEVRYSSHLLDSVNRGKER